MQSKAKTRDDLQRTIGGQKASGLLICLLQTCADVQGPQMDRADHTEQRRRALAGLRASWYFSASI